MENRPLIYLRILRERVEFRFNQLKKNGCVESMLIVEHRRHGFCGIMPKQTALTALAEKARFVLEA